MMFIASDIKVNVKNKMIKVSDFPFVMLVAMATNIQINWMCLKMLYQLYLVLQEVLQVFTARSVYIWSKNTKKKYVKHRVIFLFEKKTLFLIMYIFVLTRHWLDDFIFDNSKRLFKQQQNKTKISYIRF